MPAQRQPVEVGSGHEADGRDPVPDLLVTGGTVVTDGTSCLADVAVVGEQVAAVGDPGSLGHDARRVLDAAGCLVVPGGVDPHVHYSLAFGAVCSETQDYSPAAAIGGTTTVIDFALCLPPGGLHDAVEAKRAEAEGRMAVDWGLHAILAGPEIGFEVLEEIGDVVAGGVPTIKTFTTYGWKVDDGHRWGIMREVADAGGMSLLHAEDDDLASWLTRKYLREGKVHGAYISETRNALVEEAAVRRAMLLAERSGSALYVLHMAAASGVEALAEGRARGLAFYGETLTPYLSFTADDLWHGGDRGLLWNNYPTLKHQADQEVLWAALADDRLQVVASDHFSTTVADHLEKMGTRVDGMCAGHANVELRVPVSYHLGVAGGRLGVERWVDVVATNPARLMGLHPKKGTVRAGADADLVVFDPSASWTVRAEDLHMAADYSCWEGWEVQGRVRTTVLRGSVVAQDGEFVGDAGGGRFLRRHLPGDVVDGTALRAARPLAAAT